MKGWDYREHLKEKSNKIVEKVKGDVSTFNSMITTDEDNMI